MTLKLSDFERATRIEPPDQDRAWAGVRIDLEARRRAHTRRWVIGFPLMAVAAAAVVLFVWKGRPAPETAIETGGSFESNNDEVALALPDGVKVDLGAHSRVSVGQVTAAEIRVGLGRGHARFDVEPRHQRRFVVDVDNVEVRVVGTRFEVSRLGGGAGDDARVEVAVERGIVEVRDRRGDSEPRRLHAGERFSALIAAAERAADTDEPGTSDDEDSEASELPAGTRAPRPTGTARRHEAAAHPPTPAREEARQLLERAQRQWRAGRMSDAAGLYEEILGRFPNDPRAGLAALELGRIRMDHLGDLPGAVASLERAARSAPGASFHEDALARLAQAYARLGRDGDCHRVRDAYRDRYPNGIHAATVSGACDRPATR
jgi:hypothetical protein